MNRLTSLFHSGLLSLGLIMFCLAGCKEGSDIPNDPRTDSLSCDTFSVALTKWYGDRTAAISLTYDHGLRWLSEDEKLVQEILVQEKVPMDFDFTPCDFVDMPVRRTYYLDTLIPKGIGVFGHGYEHFNSDAVSEDSARINFRRCYDDMVAAGLKPIAYAYPGGDCYTESTRRALAASGFLSGRRFSSVDHRDPWICPYDEIAPRDWYALPNLIMFSHDFSQNVVTIDNTGMLIPFLDGAIERRAWLITTYHEIKDGLGGTYRVANFRSDIAAIRARDFWFASFNDVTLYLRQRERAHAVISSLPAEDCSSLNARLLISDDLPNDFYNHPLTVRLSVPQELIGRELAIYQNEKLLQCIPLSSETVLLSLLPNEEPYTLHPL